MPKKPNIMQKITKNVATKALALGLAANVVGCATLNPSIKLSPKEIRIEQVMRDNHTRKREDIAFYLPNGYVSHRNTEHHLKYLAGIYAGTIKIKRTKTGYIFDGFYSQAAHPEALVKVLKDADTNNDLIITMSEIFALRNKILRKQGII